MAKGSALEIIHHIKTSKNTTLNNTGCSAVKAHGMLVSAAHSEICHFELLWKLANYASVKLLTSRILTLLINFLSLMDYLKRYIESTKEGAGNVAQRLRVLDALA